MEEKQLMSFDMVSGMKTFSQIGNFAKMGTQDGLILDYNDNRSARTPLRLKKVTREDIVKYLKNPQTSSK